MPTRIIHYSKTNRLWDIPKETAERLYYEEHKSIKEIGKIYGVSTETARLYFIKHDIKIRTNSEAHKGKHPTGVTKQRMSKAHSGENNGMFGKYAKNNPNFGKHHAKSKLWNTSKKETERLYREENKSTRELAKLFKVSQTTIRTYFNLIGIKSKTIPEARKGKIGRASCRERV
jgi:transposase